MAEQDGGDPVLRNSKGQGVDHLGAKIISKTSKLQEKAEQSIPGAQKVGDASKNAKPAGGYDSTPIPSAPPGYTIKFTFHRADNLPFADINTMSADPYIAAVLKTRLETRHKQDPDLKIRIPTVHRNTDPEWNAEWVVANVPASGFFLKCRLYDEDPADHDDRLGNVHIQVDQIDDKWPGFTNKSYDVKKHMGSKRAYLLRGVASLASRRVKMDGHLFVSIENLGKTKGNDGGHMYTAGPLPWCRHYSPLIGRLAGTKDIAKGKDGAKDVEKYNFQAVQMQLQGPVPAHLYHRYVEFRPFVAGMFTSHSLRGRILNRALHHQHARIYNYDRTTVYGSFKEPCKQMTQKFLDLVDYDRGGKIFTYVITLDGLWRFTQTGKEFGIDLLSKHTMHSDVSIYIAFSGEFFLRRLRHPSKNQSGSPDLSHDTLPPAPEPDQVEAAKKQAREEGDRELEEIANRPSAEPDTDPGAYQLIIDNDSGTYRPNAEKLDVLRKFLEHSLPGLRIVTLDCQEDADKMGELKKEQREFKKQSGKLVMYMQNKSMSSISSSDASELDKRIDPEAHESKYKRQMHKYMGGGEDHHHDEVDEEARGRHQQQQQNGYNDKNERSRSRDGSQSDSSSDSDYKRFRKTAPKPGAGNQVTLSVR